MATCILHIPSRRQQIDNQGERHPIFTFKALGCRQGLLQRRSLAGYLPARPLGMRSLRLGRRHALAVDASLQYGSRLLRLVSINPTSRVIGEAKAAALDQSNDLGISKWRVEVINSDPTFDLVLGQRHASARGQPLSKRTRLLWRVRLVHQGPQQEILTPTGNDAALFRMQSATHTGSPPMCSGPRPAPRMCCIRHARNSLHYTVLYRTHVYHDQER